MLNPRAPDQVRYDALLALRPLVSDQTFVHYTRVLMEGATKPSQSRRKAAVRWG